MSLQVKGKLTRSSDPGEASQGQRAASLLKEFYWHIGSGSMIKEVDERRRQESALSDFALITASDDDINGYFGGTKQRPAPITGIGLQTILPY